MSELQPATTITPARTREERVDHIAGMMRALAWTRGKTGPILAAQWGMSPDSVKQIAAEAWRRVRAEIMDPERAAPTIVQTIETVMRDSMKEAAEADGKERTDHRRVALEAAKAFAAVVLPKPVDRHEVTLKDGRSPEELEARRLEILKQLAKGGDDE